LQLNHNNDSLIGVLAWQFEHACARARMEYRCFRETDVREIIESALILFELMNQPKKLSVAVEILRKAQRRQPIDKLINVYSKKATPD
jgi:hypothetical protein